MPYLLVINKLGVIVIETFAFFVFPFTLWGVVDKVIKVDVDFFVNVRVFGDFLLFTYVCGVYSVSLNILIFKPLDLNITEPSIDRKQILLFNYVFKSYKFVLVILVEIVIFFVIEIGIIQSYKFIVILLCWNLVRQQINIVKNAIILGVTLLPHDVFQVKKPASVPTIFLVIAYFFNSFF